MQVYDMKHQIKSIFFILEITQVVYHIEFEKGLLY